MARFAEKHTTGRDDAEKGWHIVVEWQRSAARATVVRPTGDLRGDGATSLQRRLAGELTGKPELVVLDLSGVEHMDVGGIDAVHSIAELADVDDVQFCLVAPLNDALRSCLDVAEVTTMYQTFTSIADALLHHDGRPGRQ